MERHVCIHGHFYQPPRENAWLEAIELQDSAYPYHDWNERITAECYAPNGVSRVLTGDGKIDRLVNNYSRISFNFGPTLLSWMEANSPDTYKSILEADRDSQKRFGGHGSALAQNYNHMIMPLANRRDKVTQVVWGLRDFENRFGRAPEGMWLAETAVDLETLEVLAEHGIDFTVLSPYQAAAVRAPGANEWHDVSGGRIDPTRPYLCKLPSGRSVALFFYDGPISQAVAFEGLLMKGEYLAGRLMGAFNDSRDWPQIVHIATDGETYGHHHKYGDMALAYALQVVETGGKAKLTNYGEYLQKFPPTVEVRIFSGSAWSCSHGVERWRGNCGCASGGHPGWNQEWRGPLRAAFDWLRDKVAPLFEEYGRKVFKDPWAARNDYIDVVLDRSPESRTAFLRRHAHGALSQPEQVLAFKLLEMQRHAMLMYTSCGWFFDEISGVETVQVIQYADRVLQLAEEVFGEELEEDFLKRLTQAKSNVPELGDGRGVYERFVRPARVDLPKVAAHFAVSSLFEEYGNPTRIYSYSAKVIDRHAAEAGKAKLAVGRALVTSEVTQESLEVSYAAVHFGDHTLSGGVRPYRSEHAYRELKRELSQLFARADFPALILALDKKLNAAAYSLRSLFRDEQRKILGLLLETTAESIDDTYRQIYEQNALMMRYLLGLDAPLPRSFLTAAEFILNHDLRRTVESIRPELHRIEHLLNEVATWRVPLDRPGLSYALGRTLARLMEEAQGDPDDPEPLLLATALIDGTRAFAAHADWWKAQNVYYRLMQTAYPAKRSQPQSPLGLAWLGAFVELGRRLNVRVPEPEPVPTPKPEPKPSAARVKRQRTR